ncbi:LysR family transcriptional regulator [Clostridium sp. D2Q-14]|uniref:LysR family transcriptional regulator n=1 Tax=Anaeromonas gelatinilytica TaxID=2683194 RepID=UPI00193BE092|nr:LysR family transcriptional regulator [Anaeromonas gelatinilytica]MBS4534994.1 LysR family transcriptional regulator [Anaeromonas gelatinilytica]
MNFRHLKIFITVCEEMNMTKAAKKLYISQPSVSQAISELEDYYNTKLFERLSKKIYLTKSGKELLSYSYHVLSLSDDIERVMEKKSFYNNIVLGATITIGTYFLPKILSEIKSENHDMDIKVIVKNTSFIKENLLNSKIDIGLVEGKIDHKDIIVKSFYEDELVIIANDKDVLSHKKDISFDDLQYRNFLMREEGSGSRDLFVEEMKRHNIEYNIAGEYNNTEAIKNATLYGLGLGIVSKMSLNGSESNINILPIKDLELSRYFSIVYHRNKYINKSISFLMDYILNLD